MLKIEKYIYKMERKNKEKTKVSNTELGKDIHKINPLRILIPDSLFMLLDFANKSKMAKILIATKHIFNSILSVVIYLAGEQNIRESIHLPNRFSIWLKEPKLSINQLFKRISIHLTFVCCSFDTRILKATVTCGFRFVIYRLVNEFKISLKAYRFGWPPQEEVVTDSSFTRKLYFLSRVKWVYY